MIIKRGHFNEAKTTHHIRIIISHEHYMKKGYGCKCIKLCNSDKCAFNHVKKTLIPALVLLIMYTHTLNKKKDKKTVW